MTLIAIGQLIRAARSKRTLAWLAERTGINEGRLSQIENGLVGAKSKNVSIDTLNRIALALDCEWQFKLRGIKIIKGKKP